MQPALIVATRTTRGFRSRAEPIANGWRMFCSKPLASSTIRSMIAAVAAPFAPRATTTASAPATNAPMKGMYAVTKVTAAIVPASGTPSSRAPTPTTTPLNAATIVTPRK